MAAWGGCRRCFCRGGVLWCRPLLPPPLTCSWSRAVSLALVWPCSCSSSLFQSAIAALVEAAGVGQ